MFHKTQVNSSKVNLFCHIIKNELYHCKRRNKIPWERSKLETTPMPMHCRQRDLMKHHDK